MTRSSEPASSTETRDASSSVHATQDPHGIESQPATGTPPRSRFPDFFIVGHHKSGTTALYEMLRRHPQIYMPELKEPKFFASDLPARLEPPTTRALPATVEEYLSLFDGARADQRMGEASPSYLRSHAAAGMIAEVAPDARIIAILREPASFLRSLHLQMVQSHVETERDLGRAIADEQVDRQGRVTRRYSEHVRYVEQLSRYHAVFPPEQVLVLIYDDFRSDNDATVRRVLRFLDVDQSVPIDLRESNPTVRVRSRQADRVIHAVTVGSGPVSRAAKATVKALAPGPLRRRALRATQRRLIYGKPEPPDEALMLELRRRFKPEVVALSSYLGRDLVALWGYDTVG
jgi:hypothetical protein